MKKKILSLLAAFFMLFGTSAMAQVDSTLEGDVNGDGVVDIADITAVIAIIKQNAEANPTYYWYVGQEAVTADNYTTIDGVTQVTSYPTKYEYTPSSRAYTYVLVANNKTVTKIEDGNLGSSISFTLDDTIKITGYSVYRSLIKISGKVYIHIS